MCDEDLYLKKIDDGDPEEFILLALKQAVPMSQVNLISNFLKLSLILATLACCQNGINNSINLCAVELEYLFNLLDAHTDHLRDKPVEFALITMQEQTLLLYDLL